MSVAKLFVATSLFAIVFLFQTALALGHIECPFPHQWSATVPPVNQNHIFCGEFHGKIPKGFHSRPGGGDPATVGGSMIVTPPNASGIYELKWWYTGHPAVPKNSTMFPDNCGQQEVLNSIIYAHNNPAPCVPAVPWGNCGPNRPALMQPGAGPYCVGAAGAGVWQIRYAVLPGGPNMGSINTAFPNP